VTERVAAERMVRELHAARVGGDLAGMCRLFADAKRSDSMTTALVTSAAR
jgi:hypothetical protein